MKRAKALLNGLVVAASFLACDNDPVAQNSDMQLTLSTDSVLVRLFETSPLIATVRNASGAVQYEVPLQYVSRDQSVANVNAQGAISAVAVGSTYVVASLSDRPDVRDSVRVRVHTDSCTLVRPDFGGMATAEDRDLFSYDVDAPLNLQKAVESTNNGVEVSAISFTSPDGGSVTGLLFDPVTRSSLRPGIVLMHGMPGNARQMAGYGQLLAQYGAVVIAIDAPHARRSGPAVLFTAQDRVEQIQLIKNLQRAVDVLRAQPNVDDERIAYVGVSYGGAMGALFVGIERRLKTAILVVGDGGLVTHSTGPEDRNFLRTLTCATRVNWFRAMAPIEPIRFVGHANVPLLLQNGTLDTLVPKADAEELHAAAPQPKTITWYEAGHGLNQFAAINRHDWLVEKIGLDPR